MQNKMSFVAKSDLFVKFLLQSSSTDFCC